MKYWEVVVTDEISLDSEILVNPFSDVEILLESESLICVNFINEAVNMKSSDTINIFK